MLFADRSFARPSASSALLMGSLCVFSFAYSFHSTALAEDQSQWGERWTRNMASSETGLPKTFSLGERDPDDQDCVDMSTTENVRWIASLGSRVYSSPVVAEGRILIGTNNDAPRNSSYEDDRGILMCLDENTGEFLWQLVVPKRDEERFFDSAKTGITSTPTVVDGRVYLATNRGDIVCLDINGMSNGNDGPYTDEDLFITDDQEQEPLRTAGPLDADILWRFDMVETLGIRSHDASNCCPLIYDGVVYCGTANGLDEAHAAVARPELPALIALDAETGRLLARDDDWVGPDVVHGQWSSPTMGTIDGRELILYGGGNGRLNAFTPLDREVLLEETPFTPGQNCLENLARINTVWTFDGQPELVAGEELEFQPGRGSESYTCVATPVIWDDRVYMAFSHDPWMGDDKGWFACIDPSGEGDITTTGLLWSKTLSRESLSSPAITEDGVLYLADNGGTTYCLEAETGEEHWTFEAEAMTWGSTLVADGQVYLGTSKRKLYVFEDSTDMTLLAEHELLDAMFNTPTAANGTLFIATGRFLYAIEAEDAE
jgi:outer membrane protein assembly factor BamB